MNIWMIRAGEGGRLIDDFEKGYVAIGYSAFGDMSNITKKEEIATLYKEGFPDTKPGAVATSIAIFHRFSVVIEVGDKVVSYDVANREYILGEIGGNYEYKPELVGDYPHVRKVLWQGRVSRDVLSTSSKNILGSALTLYKVPDEVWNDLQAGLSGKTQKSEEPIAEEAEGSLVNLRDDIKEKAHEFIKDKILALDPDEMEELVAAILRGMGYRARVTPKGPDRGVDVFASPDGLGLEEPRIKIEVKHRAKTAMAAGDIRSFIGALRQGDRGIYVSTGGFSREARYEADRANMPLTMLNLDDIARLIVEHYENFDLNGQALIPLVRVYWPAV